MNKQRLHGVYCNENNKKKKLRLNRYCVHELEEEKTLMNNLQ